MLGDKCSVLFVNESFIFFHKYLRRILGAVLLPLFWGSNWLFHPWEWRKNNEDQANMRTEEEYGEKN